MIKLGKTALPRRTNRLGEFVLKRRKDLGLTQREVAEALGLGAKEFVGMIEKGTRQPNYERLPALAKVLDTHVLTLLQLVMWDTYPHLAKLIFSKNVAPGNTAQFKSEPLVIRKLNALPLDSRQVIVKMIDELYAEHMGRSKRRSV